MRACDDSSRRDRPDTPRRNEDQDARRQPLPPRFPRFRRGARPGRRARGGGRRRHDGDDLDARAPLRRGKGGRRALRQRLLLGRDASAQRARGTRRNCRRSRASRRASEGRRDRGGGARLPLRQLPREAQAAGPPHPYRCGPHDRAAARHPCPRSGCGPRGNPEGRDGEGSLSGCSALLFFRPRARRDGHRARPLCLVLGHPHVQEFPGNQGHSARSSSRSSACRDRRAVSRAAAASGKAQRAGLRRGDGRRARARCAASSRRRSPSRRRRTSSGSSPKCRGAEARS